MKPLDKKDVRWTWARPERSVVKDFGCLIRGQVKSDDPGYIAITIEGEKRKAFNVRVWNTGRITAGCPDTSPPEFFPPALDTAGHAKPHVGEKANELLVIVQGGVMRTFINGKTAAEPMRLPAGFAGPSVSLFLCQDGKSAGRIVVSRFKLWRLDSPGSKSHAGDARRPGEAEAGHRRRFP